MSEEFRSSFPPEEIRWGMKAPGTRRQGFRRWSPKPWEERVFWVLSEKLEDLETHYWCGYTVPCKADPRVCPACQLGQESRGKGYLAALALPLCARVDLVELTPYAIEGCPQLTSATHALRGSRLKVWRAGKYGNSPVMAQMVGWQELPKKTPLVDVRDMLERMWGGAYRRIGRARPGGADDTTGAEGPSDA